MGSAHAAGSHGVASPEEGAEVGDAGCTDAGSATAVGSAGVGSGGGSRGGGSGGAGSVLEYVAGAKPGESATAGRDCMWIGVISMPYLILSSGAV